MADATIRRIRGDIRHMQQCPKDRYYAMPLDGQLSDWHFTIRGPSDTPHATGIYHGRIGM